MDELLWAEDLQCHREPSLYYLDQEEDKNGPHLICDWNGTPTDFDEFDLDILSSYKECTPHETSEQIEETIIEDDCYDYPNPTSEIAKTLESNRSNLIMGNNDRNTLDFLSVPPITSGLIKRIVRSAQILKTAQQAQATPVMPPISENKEDGVSSQKSSRPKKTARASTICNQQMAMKKEKHKPLTQLRDIGSKSVPIEIDDD